VLANKPDFPFPEGTHSREGMSNQVISRRKVIFLGIQREEMGSGITPRTESGPKVLVMPASGFYNMEACAVASAWKWFREVRCPIFTGTL